MKRILAFALVLVLLLSGCGSKAPAAENETVAAAPEAVETQSAETAAPAEDAAEATEATTEQEATEAPEDAPEVYRNPLNGEILDEPFTGRLFANTVSNMQDNLPHVGLIHADVVFETYVNSKNIVRCLALFSDIESVDAIGSTRSTRPMFNDIAQHYDLILSHAGGSDQALEDAHNRGIDNFNIDAWVVQSAGTSYRDTQYKRAYENTLFGIGSGIKAYAESQGMEMELERGYGFEFTEDGTPAEGEDVTELSIQMVYKNAKKDTIMEYNEELDKFIYRQYGEVMADQITGEVEAFTNVIVMFADITNNGIYQVTEFTDGGIGYYANGGKVIPIIWTCDGDDQPFCFLTEDAEPLLIGEGNTYIAICTYDSIISADGAELGVEEEVIEETAQTTEETAAG